MQVPPPRPDYRQASPPALVEHASPDFLDGDLKKALREADRIASHERELSDIERACAEKNKRGDDLRAATDELNEEKDRPVLDRRAERRR
jgi:hypothetical protein